jgi:hypothetical protein
MSDLIHPRTVNRSAVKAESGLLEQALKDFLAIVSARVIAPDVDLKAAKRFSAPSHLYSCAVRTGWFGCAGMAGRLRGLYFGRYVTQGRFGIFGHAREMADIDQQDVVRMNRDTIYSSGEADCRRR